MAGDDEELFELFEDLEAQAEALHHAERAAEVADRSRAEYRSVTLDGRLMASVGRTVGLDVVAVGRVSGLLDRVGPGWCQVAVAGADWLVRTPAVVAVRGASERSLPEVAWSPVQRLGLASALRRLAEEGEECLVQASSGDRYEGTLRRVGADFLEVAGPGRTLVLVSLDRLAGVRVTR